jgi:hypothetical protein
MLAALAVPVVGSKGDSYDNALAETINGWYKLRQTIIDNFPGRPCRPDSHKIAS